MDAQMNKSLTNKRILLTGFLPVLGVLVSFILNFIAGPAYTTSLNQGALRFYFMGSIMWSVFAFFIGIYMYSKCRTMNHVKFLLGISSVSIGATMPWLIGIL